MKKNLEQYFLKKIEFTLVLNKISYKDGYRTIEYRYFDKIKTGYIIGKVIRYEGNYMNYSSPEEPPELINRKGFWFWEVVTSMNLKVLVPVV